MCIIVLFSIGESLATKCVLLNNEPCMNRPTPFDLNFVALSYYSFMINLDKCNESCNAADDLSTKICVLSEQKI